MNTLDDQARQDAVEDAFCQYLQNMDTGAPFDKEAFLARYPEIADSLAEHLAADSVVRQLAGPSFAETQTDFEGTLVFSSPERSALKETVLSHPSTDTRCDKQHTHWGIPEEFGRYRVKKLLGQGAMGAVYLAHDTQLDRDVALKIPKFEQQKDSEILERFYREARAVATLHHPNICPVYDVGEIEGQAFLSMAYIQGRPLSDFAKSEKKQAERSAAKLVMKLSLALQEAHEIGVVHRDLKPANIMVSKKGEPVVMDFGLARRLDSNDTRVTQSGTIVGTPAYMSPEQVEGNPNAIGPLSDQFSLGVILYELLTGRLPFHGSVLSVIGQIAHVEPKSIEELRPDLDPRLAAICKRMMAKKSEDRFENMTAVASAINGYLVESKAGAAPENQSLWDQAKAVAPAGKAPQPTRRASQRRLPGKPTRKGRTKRRKASLGRPRWMTALGSVAVLLLAAGIFYFQTAEGVVRIEIKDPEIHVQFQNETFTIDDNGTPIDVKPGKHKLLVKRGDLELPTEEFTVSRNGKTAIEVTWLDGVLTVQNDGKTIGSHRTAPGAPPIGGPSRSTKAKEQITLVRRFEGHELGIFGLGFLKGGDRAVSSSADGTVRFWNLETGEEFWRFKSDFSVMGARGLAVAPDGNLVAMGDGAGQVYLLDAAAGQQVRKFAAHEHGIPGVAFSPDGGRLATCDWAGSLKLWEVATGREIQLSDGKMQGSFAVAFSPDGREILAGGKPVRRYDAATGRLIEEIDLGEVTTYSVAYAPDGNTFACGLRNGPIVLSDRAGGGRFLLRGHTAGARDLRFTTDGRYLISGGPDKSLRVWDVRSRSEVLRLDGPTHAFNHVALSPDGNRLLTAGGWDWDETDSRNLWDGAYALSLWQLPESVWPKKNPTSGDASLKSKEQITLIRKLSGLSLGVEDLEYAPDGKSVLAMRGYDVRRWSVEEGRLLTRTTLKTVKPMTTIVPLKDNERIVAGTMANGTGPKLWNLRTLEALREFEGHPADGFTFACDVSPDERLLLTNGANEALRVWELETGRELYQIENKMSWGAAVFSPDGQRIAKGQWNTLTIHDVETGELLRTIRPMDMGSITTVAFSPDSQLVLAGGSGGSRGQSSTALALHEVSTGRRLHYLPLPEQPHSCAFLADGRHFVAGCEDKTLRIWNTQTGQEVFRLTTENHSTNFVAVAPDGKTLASGGGLYWDEEARERNQAKFDGDSNVYLWQLPDSLWPKSESKSDEDASKSKDQITLVQKLKGHKHGGGRNALSLSADGRYLLSAGGSDKSAILWDLKTGGSLAVLSQHDASVIAVAISADGKLGLTADFSGMVHVWDLITFKKLREIKTSEKHVTTVRFLPDGKRFVSAAEGAVSIWDLETGDEVRRIEVPGYIGDLTVVPAGKFLLASAPDDWLCHLETGEKELWQKAGIYTANFSRDGSLMVTGLGIGDVKLWDFASQREIRRFLGHSDDVGRVDFLPGEKHLISGSSDGTIRLWDVQTGTELARLEGLGHLANVVLPLPDGKHIISFGGPLYQPKGPDPMADDWDIRVWNLPESVWPNVAGDEPMGDDR